MRRLRNDLPYTFRPPRLNRWFRPLALFANRHWLLKRKYRVTRIEEVGFERIRELDATGDSMLLAPNHADHADPHLMVESTFCSRLTRLEDRIGWLPKPGMPLDDRILRLGRGVLGLKENEFLEEMSSGGIQQRLELLCSKLLEIVEARMGADANASTAPERVRAMRYRIRRRLFDESNLPGEEERATLLDDLDRVFTALQAHSYIGDYLLAEPTLNRRAETIMKLEEDLLGFPNYPANRTATVVAGEPISISKLVEKGELARKGGATKLTRLLEARLTELIKPSC